MNQANTIQTSDPSILNYASLRQQGIECLERLASSAWTDFNEHDPGITILEQFCYALTDLSYRIGYDVKDLLAEGGTDLYRWLYSPAEVLTSQPVTLSDFRKVLIDLDGVRNAWIEAAKPDELPTLCYDEADSNLYLQSAPHRESVALRGLYRVLIQCDGSRPEADVIHSANRRLQGCRNVGQDFLSAEIIARQEISVKAKIEIGNSNDSDALLAEIYNALANFIAPRITFQNLVAMQTRAKRVDEIMDGPLLAHGFIDDTELASLQRKTALRVSDLIQVIMDVTGVNAIDSISISSNAGADEAWYLTLDANSLPVLAINTSAISLLRNGTVVATDLNNMKTRYAQLQQTEQAQPLQESERDIRLGKGRDRQAGRYHSIQYQFPAVYGIGEAGLPATVPALRQAQARQLQAYLLFFDQLLANDFVQLANLPSLFAFDAPPTPQTYFSQAVDDADIGLDSLWKSAAEQRAAKLETFSEGTDSAIARKNRFLNHLLARFAENFADFSQYSFGAATPAAQMRAKCAFLQNYRQLGSRRATAFDYSLPSVTAENISGLEQRIRLKLGLGKPQALANLPTTGNGGFYLLEHILLRPGTADNTAMLQEIISGSWQAGVLLALPSVQRSNIVCCDYAQSASGLLTKDPYSQQISFIFPDWLDSFKKPQVRDCIRQLLRNETPAHLHVRLLWLDKQSMQTFETAYQKWRKNFSPPSTDNIAARDARDRLLDCLGLGTAYPFRDVALKYDAMVALNQQETLHILNAQEGVSYTLCNENGDFVINPDTKKPYLVLCAPGNTVQEAILPLPLIDKDIGFTILASREYDVFGSQLPTALDAYLMTTVSIKAGINSNLAVEFKPLSGQISQNTRITVNYADSVQVTVKASQSGISYQLIDMESKKIISASVPGNKNDITLMANIKFNENAVLQIQAYRTLEPTNSAYLNQQLSVLVRPNLHVTANLALSTLDYAAQTTLTLVNAQTSVAYQLFKRDLSVDDYPVQPSSDPLQVIKTVNQTNKSTLTPLGKFQWTGATCAISSGVLNEDALLCVQASKAEIAETLWLERALVVLVRPNPAPTVSATALKIPSGASGTITVTGTQRGVTYQLRLDADNTNINAPGYHWEDRCINTTRLEVDFVVEKPNQPEDYKTLLLPTGNLTQKTPFNVLAHKTLTGLEAPLTGKISIDIGG